MNLGAFSEFTRSPNNLLESGFSLKQSFDSDPEFRAQTHNPFANGETRKGLGSRTAMLLHKPSADRLEGGQIALGINVEVVMLDFPQPAAGFRQE